MQESYLGKIKMIYIDPPYNTGNDFIYRDNFAESSDDYEENIGVYSENGERLFKNTDANGRFHSDWCSMIYSRLLLARNLLTDDGVIYISIDDGEQANLREISDEVLDVYKRQVLKGHAEPLNEPMERPLEEKILQLIRNTPNCTYDALAESLEVSRSTVKRTMKLLAQQGKIERIGGKRYGYWQIHD